MQWNAGILDGWQVAPRTENAGGGKRTSSGGGLEQCTSTGQDTHNSNGSNAVAAEEGHEKEGGTADNSFQMAVADAGAAHMEKS